MTQSDDIFTVVVAPVQQSERDDQQMIDVFVANIRSGGDTASVLESTYGLKRVGY